MFGVKNLLNISFSKLGQINKKDDPFLEFANYIGSSLAPLKKLKVMTDQGTVFEVEVSVRETSTSCDVNGTTLTLDLIVMGSKKSEF